MSHGLNPAQHEAVNTLSGPLLVLAGAGTGKTRVVTFRIANLIRNGTAADRILAVTFTNKAAGEMQERIAELLGISKRPSKKDDRPRPVIGTFHSQCVRILRQHATNLGYPKKFAIYDRSDQESIARSVLRELRLPTAALKPGDLLSIIGQWKNGSIHPDAAVNEARTDKEHLAAAGYRRYQNSLKACGAMDFDDLLLNTEVLFTEHEEVRQSEADRFDHILVDEYQDTNGSQYRIIKALADAHRNLCVVGDDDQSIYGWRGADVRHILNFKKDWEDATVVRLEDNYRSTGSILEMANRLIQYNTVRHDKSLKPARPAGQRPRISQFKDETEESQRVVGEIGRLIELNHYQPGEIAILFRTKEQPRLFEQELRKAALPYVMMGSQSFFDRREVRDVVAYLKWVEQPDDEVSLMRVANTPPRGLGQGTVKLLMDAAVKRGQPIWQVMCDDTVTSTLPPAARRGIDDLRGILVDVQNRIRDDGLTEAVNTLIARTRYMDEIRTRYNEPEECEARIASIGEVVNAVDAYADRAKKPSLTDFLSEIALSGREMGNEKDRAAQQNAIWLLTMHAAKGLEFPVVYMVGMEDGLLPHHRSTKGDDDAIAEERRLCYVGITRAQEKLTLSLALTRRKWGKPRPTTPSRFLYEITGQADNPNRYRK
ncbi:ATP-dependent DNA helicase PcrA [Rosistilla oblonga]|uniref:DNA 3'-5' helicase n=2 Tax=Rosistilla TaxID=2795779 RepID=A0A518IPW6_9BACT|nr:MULTISPECIES: UvrD-helicase domain-containing protein [Rosistilla]QDS86836.1 ATP-dependent DNA helicase PcrA [Rosistilla ulvae]QDV11212.1 ATP-dependent DNA helicase PcrA [Rosistilla oblonga]QDV55139.1 ATP-dependent DNA helicase PcrA [Rosistilla oblonga]